MHDDLKALDRESLIRHCSELRDQNQALRSERERLKRIIEDPGELRRQKVSAEISRLRLQNAKLREEMASLRDSLEQIRTELGDAKLSA